MRRVRTFAVALRAAARRRLPRPGLRTRVAALASVVAIALAFAAVLAPSPVGADVTTGVISSSGPLTTISISPDLNCAVSHTGDSDGEWFGSTACGTLVSVRGTLYGPASIPAGGSATGVSGYTPYTPVSQQNGGSGTSDDPFTITTVVTLGDSRLRLTEIDSYVVGEESYRTSVTVANPASDPVPAIIHRGGDCYLQDSDSGLGEVQNGNAPVCQALPESADPNRIEAMYPLTGGSRYVEDYYNTMWSDIGSQQPLPDTCQCDSEIDNALAVSWSKSLPAKGSTTVSALTVFSPLGSTPLVFGKTADSGSAAAGASDGYTITVTNDGPTDETLDDIVDSLPTGFSYQPGTSTGETNVDPTIGDDGSLTWSGPFDVPSENPDSGAPGEITLHFDVSVSSMAGTYTNSVTGSGDGVSVIPATNVAPVTVSGSTGPVAADDSYTTSEDTPLSVPSPGLLANDSPQGQIQVDPDSVTAPGHGTVTAQQDGSFVYTPAAGFSGTDSFTYEITEGDSESAPATVTIQVNPADQRPEARNDSYKTNEDTALTEDAANGVLANDTDPDGDTLTASLVDNPSDGAVQLNPDGSFTYTPLADFNGLDSFTYQASDGTDTSRVATVHIHVIPVSDRIVAKPDSYTATEGQQLQVISEGGVLVNDVRPDNAPLAAVLDRTTFHGVLQLNSDGSFVYTPNDSFSGTDSFLYHDQSGDTTSNTTKVTITVQRVNHAPIARDDSYSTTAGVPKEVDAPGVLANDTDPDGDTLAAILQSSPSHGTLSYTDGDDLSSGGFVYTPDDGFSGTDSFTYVANDGTLASNIATVTITVRPSNLRPVANSDNYQTHENTTLHITAPGVLHNDTDPNDLPLTAQVVHTTRHGSLVLNPDGSFTYTPDAGFVGADVFSYRAADSQRFSTPVTVTIAVIAPNHAPVARPDDYSTNENVTLSLPLPGVLGNDTDADGNALSALRVHGTAHGTLHLKKDGAFRYIPNHGFSGQDAFRYRATDGMAFSHTVTVSIAVIPLSAPPTPTPTPTGPSAPVPGGPTGGPTVPVGPVIVPTIGPVTGPTAPSSGSTGPPPPVSPGPPSSGSHPPTHRIHNKLRLSAPSVNPGGTLNVSGSGCQPGSPVLLAIHNKPAGRATADGSGRFMAQASAPRLAPGSYRLTATCGNAQLVSQVSLVFVTGSSAAPAAQGLTVAAMFGFFLLLIGLVLRRPTITGPR